MRASSSRRIESSYSLVAPDFMSALPCLFCSAMAALSSAEVLIVVSLRVAFTLPVIAAWASRFAVDLACLNFLGVEGFLAAMIILT